VMRSRPFNHTLERPAPYRASFLVTLPRDTHTPTLFFDRVRGEVKSLPRNTEKPLPLPVG